MNPDHKLKQQTFKLVSWPSPQDYQEAIQAPLLNVDDQELQAGEVEQNALGLPRPRTGFFATVYKMQCGSTNWAIRCFLNNIQDQEQRYAELSKFVMSDKLDCTVRFHYVEQGIKVRGSWYPILKMEWVDGETLGEFVEHNVHDFDAMRKLALQFETMMSQLQVAGVAHGDLQHGNIIVSGDAKSEISLRLVDYDGMFVPSFRGWQSNELGHRNYQHPARNASHFGPTLDNFSAWLIYCSLICLAIDPALWDELNGGDECLLFRQEDFRDIRSSRAFSVMLHHQSPIVRDCADWLSKLSAMPPDEVPYLSFGKSRAEALTLKQRTRRAFDVRKISIVSPHKKPGSSQNEQQPQSEQRVQDQLHGQTQSTTTPSHLYRHPIVLKGARTPRVVGMSVLVALVLMYVANVFGQALFNRQNTTMFPKRQQAVANLNSLPAEFSESEEGRNSIWKLSPSTAGSDKARQHVKRYEIVWDDGSKSEVFLEPSKTAAGALIGSRRDLTGLREGMQVHYEGSWDGSTFSGVANFAFKGSTWTNTFKAHPKLSWSHWLKLNQARDEFKR